MQIRYDSGEEAEEVFRMRLLDVGELLSGSVPDERRTASLEQP
jgi:hypothetical protein